MHCIVYSIEYSEILKKYNLIRLQKKASKAKINNFLDIILKKRIIAIFFNFEALCVAPWPLWHTSTRLIPTYAWRRLPSQVKICRDCLILQFHIEFCNQGGCFKEMSTNFCIKKCGYVGKSAKLWAKKVYGQHFGVRYVIYFLKIVLELCFFHLD